MDLQPGTRLVIGPERREQIQRTALEAVFVANEHRELSYTVEQAIEVAVEAAIDALETLLAASLLA